MTDEFSGSNVFKLFVFLLVIAFYRPNVAASLSNETTTAFPKISSTPATTRWANVTAQISAPNQVALVEAPIEVNGPRAVESTIAEKVERKRENRIKISSKKNSRQACILEDDAPWEENHKVSNDKRRSDGVKKRVRLSLRRSMRGSHSRSIDREQEEEYDDDEDDDPEISDDDEDNDEDNDDDVDNEVRRNPKRKAGRRHRQGPRIWDQWGKWSGCSVSCGAGKLTRWRHCVAGGCSLGNSRNLDPKVWDQWGKWSCCSATCGSGKYTRWRHCVAGGCVSGEKEAQIKSCKLNRCS